MHSFAAGTSEAWSFQIERQWCNIARAYESTLPHHQRPDRMWCDAVDMQQRYEVAVEVVDHALTTFGSSHTVWLSVFDALKSRVTACGYPWATVAVATVPSAENEQCLTARRVELHTSHAALDRVLAALERVRNAARQSSSSSKASNGVGVVIRARPRKHERPYPDVSRARRHYYAVVRMCLAPEEYRAGDCPSTTKLPIRHGRLVWMVHCAQCGLHLSVPSLYVAITCTWCGVTVGGAELTRMAWLVDVGLCSACIVCNSYIFADDDDDEDELGHATTAKV